ncbi:MAG: hypothetical protein ACJA0Z_003801 [Halioglobus sp.]|jgi:hypothetical protein
MAFRYWLGTAAESLSFARNNFTEEHYVIIEKGSYQIIDSTHT